MARLGSSSFFVLAWPGLTRQADDEPPAEMPASAGAVDREVGSSSGWRLMNRCFFKYVFLCFFQWTYSSNQAWNF